MFAAEGAKAAGVAAQVEAAQVQSGGFRDERPGHRAGGRQRHHRALPALPRRVRGRADGAGAGAWRAAGAGRQPARRTGGQGHRLRPCPTSGLTPYAAEERALHTDTDRAALLTRLTTAFNEQLGVNVLLDGRYVGLVQADLQFRAHRTVAGELRLRQRHDGVCTVALPLCRNDTLVPDGSAFIYLWADDTRMSSGGQAQLATLAVDRAQRNPLLTARARSAPAARRAASTAPARRAPGRAAAACAWLTMATST